MEFEEISSRISGLNLQPSVIEQSAESTNQEFATKILFRVNINLAKELESRLIYFRETGVLDEQSANFANSINSSILRLYPSISRGDIIYTNEEMNPAFGVFIWDNGIVPLDYSVDPNGGLPRNFLISDTEFSPSYWSFAIDFEYVWFAPEIRQRIFTNLIYNEKEGEWQSYFLLGNKRYLWVPPDPELSYDEVVSYLLDSNTRFSSTSELTNISN
jgi:hypothetical protein